MLKIRIDQGGDYLDYLKPFIYQILIEYNPDPVTDTIVEGYIKNKFGLIIPTRTINIVLGRIYREGSLKRERHGYIITDKLQDPKLDIKKTEAERHINSVVVGLLQFSKTTQKPLLSHDAAVSALCSFLSEFNIQCIKAFIRGTPIPEANGDNDSNIVLVSNYVLNIFNTSPERFNSFMIMTQGHMLANALLCPDLQNTSKTYTGVTFFIDTPLVIHALGLDSDIKKTAILNIFEVIVKLNGKIAVFSHTREEIDNVINGAVEYYDKSTIPIVLEAKRNNITKSDLLLISQRIDDRLREMEVKVKNTPKYSVEFNFNESHFESMLNEKVNYPREKAKIYDINSVRSIYELRKNNSPRFIEECDAILITNNTGFSRVAFEFGKTQRQTSEVSSVISDYEFANLAWLKSPMQANSIPRSEMMAYAYAAHQPSMKFLSRMLIETEKLEKNGDISPRDHELMRSSPIAAHLLYNNIMGDEKLFTKENIDDTIRRVENEIRGETMERLLESERKLIIKTQQIEKTERTIYNNCTKKAKRYMILVEVLLTFLFFLIITLNSNSSAYIPQSNIVAPILSVILSLISVYAISIIDPKGLTKIETKLINYFVIMEKDRLGI